MYKNIENFVNIRRYLKENPNKTTKTRTEAPGSEVTNIGVISQNGLESMNKISISMRFKKRPFTEVPQCFGLLTWPMWYC